MFQENINMSESIENNIPLECILTALALAIVLARRSIRSKRIGKLQPSQHDVVQDDIMASTGNSLQSSQQDSQSSINLFPKVIQTNSQTAENIERIRDALVQGIFSHRIPPSISNSCHYLKDKTTEHWKIVSCLFHFRKFDVPSDKQHALLANLMTDAQFGITSNLDIKEPEGTAYFYIQKVVELRTKLNNVEFFHKLIFGFSSFFNLCTTKIIDCESAFSIKPSSILSHTAPAAQRYTAASGINFLQQQYQPGTRVGGTGISSLNYETAFRGDASHHQRNNDRDTCRKILHVKARLLTSLVVVIIELCKVSRDIEEDREIVNMVYERLGTLCLLVKGQILAYVSEANRFLRANRYTMTEQPNVMDYFDRSCVHEIIFSKSAAPEDWAMQLLEGAASAVENNRFFPMVHRAFQDMMWTIEAVVS